MQGIHNQPLPVVVGSSAPVSLVVIVMPDAHFAGHTPPHWRCLGRRMAWYANTRFPAAGRHSRNIKVEGLPMDQLVLFMLLAWLGCTLVMTVRAWRGELDELG
jgi:hypothetical protein